MTGTEDDDATQLDWSNRSNARIYDMQGMQGKWCERHGLNVKDIHRYRGKISDC